MGYETSVDVKEAHPTPRINTVNGTSVQFRAYIGVDDEKYLIWKIDGQQGDSAIPILKDGIIRLPQGRQITVNGDRVTKFQIPSFLSDSLKDDFRALEEGEVESESDRSETPQ